MDFVEVLSKLSDQREFEQREGEEKQQTASPHRG
jgi:hypothetical protein